MIIDLFLGPEAEEAEEEEYYGSKSTSLENQALGKTQRTFMKVVSINFKSYLLMVSLEVYSASFQKGRTGRLGKKGRKTALDRVSHGLICKGTWCLYLWCSKTMIMRQRLLVSLKKRILEMLWEKMKIRHSRLPLMHAVVYQGRQDQFLTFADDIMYK